VGRKTTTQSIILEIRKIWTEVQLTYVFALKYKKIFLLIQLLTYHLIIFCSSKIQNGLAFWCRLTQVVLDKKAIKRM